MKLSEAIDDAIKRDNMDITEITLSTLYEWKEMAEELEDKINPEWLCVNCTEDLKVKDDLCEDCLEIRDKDNEPRGIEYEHPNDGDSDE